MKNSNLKYLIILALGLFIYSCNTEEAIVEDSVSELQDQTIEEVFGVEGIADDDNARLSSKIRAKIEAIRIVKRGAREAKRNVFDFIGLNRSFRDELSVFLPSAIDVDENNLRDNTKANVTLPIYEGTGPSGKPTYFIITEATTPVLAKIYGAILSPKLKFGALPTAATAAQRVHVSRRGRIHFKGDVDFSPVRRLEAGSSNPDEAFPPSVAEPGAIGDSEYSSLVVLPSGNVINCQIIANDTGIHDRINWIDIKNRKANFQLLDGWEGGDKYYYHLVTDASDVGAATIELGVYAPRMANLPVFGQSGIDGETVLLGFSPNGNGLTLEGGADPSQRQGLNSTILDDDLDPVNVFPFDPDNNDPNNNYSPMWDAHISMWTDEAINGPNGDVRRPITGFDDLQQLIQEGLITSNAINQGIENDFLFGLRATNAVINCPVILHPFQGEND